MNQLQLLYFGLALAFYFALHSLLAAHSVKAFLIQSGLSEKYYRLVYNALAVGFLIPIYLLYKNIRATFFFENVGIQYLGLGIVVVGIVFLLVALKQYNLAEFAGTQQLKTNANPAPAKLKVSGFNAIVRHPLYFSMLIVLWGGFLFRSTDLVLVVALVSSVYLYVGTKLEERKLVAEFGEAYLEYQKSVGMLVPFKILRA